jgi:hypothetical protein
LGEIKAVLLQYRGDLTHGHNNYDYEERAAQALTRLITESKLQLLKEVEESVMGAIGEDDKQVWDEEAMFCETCAFQPTDTTLNCICIFRNKLRTKQRTQIIKSIETIRAEELKEPL